MTENEGRAVFILAALLAFVLFVVRDNFRRKKSERGKERERAQRLLALRKNLLMKTFGNESKVDTLIDYERKRFGELPLEELMEAAIERWEKDNR